PGRGGVEHVILPEKGLVTPGELIMGADSHTCTYGALGAFSTGVGSTDLGVVMATGRTWLKVPATIKVNYTGRPGAWIGGKDLILYTIGILGVEGANYRALEFGGPALKHLSMDNRFTICNMAVEAGAKNGIMEADEITLAYLKDRSSKSPMVFRSDPEALYERILNIDAASLEPQVALPHSPDRVKAVSQVGRVNLDQVFIGSCTNGRLGDLEIAASLLTGRKASTRLIVLPGSSEVYLDAIKKGIIETFVKAGAVVGPPSCGPCLGGHLGILADGEKALSTTNRNFLGRMGHPGSEVYLAGPAVAAASAVLGRIAGPEEI
ncbi:homoaconitate hydratase family protein, partial [bacterium]|nr:homoaconitate hydratase family protein [bacterium]